MNTNLGKDNIISPRKIITLSCALYNKASAEREMKQVAKLVKKINLEGIPNSHTTSKFDNTRDMRNVQKLCDH